MLAIVGCSQLVTLAGPARPRVGAEMRELSVIPDGAMLVRDGRIEKVGTRREIEPLIQSQQVVDVQGRVVMPGFVDAHTHPVFGRNRANEFEMRAQGRTYQEIAAAGGGIKSTMRATRAASEDELFERGRKYADWFLRCGTTTVEAKSGYGLSVGDELKLLRVIRRLSSETPLSYVPTFLGAHSFPDDCSREEYIERVVVEMLPAVASEGLAVYCDIFCEQRYYTADDARRILGAARGHGLGLRMHVDQLTCSGGAELAAELGAKTADHLEQTGMPGIRALKEAGVQPVLLPGSVYALGLSKYPDGRAMIDEGLAVVLATDFNPGSSPTPSIPMAISLAATHMRMTQAESIVASTINAAYSLDLGEDRGSLEVGKRADFVVFDCDDYREIGYWFGVEQAAEVFVEGENVKR